MAVQATTEFHPLAGDLVPVAQPVHVRRPGTRISVRTARSGAVLVSVAVLVAALVLVVGASPVVAVTVPATALLVHLGARLRTRSGEAGLLVLVAVPVATVACLVAAGVLRPDVLPAVAWTALVAGTVLRTTQWSLRARRHHRVLLVGPRRELPRAVASWEGPCRRLTVVGTAPVDPDTDLGQQLDDVGSRVVELGADTVVALPSLDAGAVRRLGWSLEGTGAVLALCPAPDGVGHHRLATRRYADRTLLEVAPARASGPTRVVKAVADRLGALVLLVALLPVLVAIAVLVRLDSRGGVLFAQTRIGRYGRPFTMYKFRTMCPDADAVKRELAELDEGNGMLFKVRRDPRVTRVGRGLRRFSLDELPQLLNVLRGEMSLVGPRPALPEEVGRYDALARRRLVVRPGLTGLWQVSGRSELDWDTTVALDLAYADNITLAQDLRICARTVGAVTGGRGAY